MTPPAFYQPQIAETPAADSTPACPESGDLRHGILVRATNWLGDNLISMPALWRLREALPASTPTTVLCKSSLAPLWGMADWIDRVIAFDGRRVSREDKERIRESPPAAALILPNSFGAALDLCGCGIRLRLGRGGRGRGLLLTRRLPAWRREWRNRPLHQVNHYFDLASQLRPLPRRLPAEPWLRVAPETMKKTRLRLDLPPPDDRPWLAIAPGAAYGPAKQWPAEHFRKTAEACAQAGFLVIVLGTARERPTGDLLCQNLGNARNLCGQTDLSELAAVLAMAKVCLCNDSGTMHLAAGLGRSGVAVFGSTSAAATGPLGGRWLVLDGGAACPRSPCFRRECPLPRDRCRCLRSISPEQAREAVESLASGESF